MYILMISRGVPTKKYPQWGCFEKDQAEAISNNGHKVIVISVDSRLMFCLRKIGITHVYKNGVNYYNSFWVPGLFTRFLGYRFNLFVKELQIKRLYKYIESQHGKPDIIYGQFFFNTVLGVCLKKKYRIPLVGIEHAARFNDDRLDCLSARTASLAYRNVDAAIAVSNTLGGRLKFHFNLDCYIINNLVGNEFINGVNLLESRVEALKFISVGSLIYRKGFDLLVLVFKKLALPADKWQLIIIGDGEEKENLQEQINNAGLQENIHLLGQKTKSEIVTHLRESNVFVLPSRNENFSVAVLEALACGLPIISSICGGIKECIDDKNGLLFPVDDVDALAKQIKYMFEHYQTYDRNAIAEDCRNRYSPSVIASKLIDVFEVAIEQYNANKNE